MYPQMTPQMPDASLLNAILESTRGDANTKVPAVFAQGVGLGNGSTAPLRTPAPLLLNLIAARAAAAKPVAAQTLIPAATKSTAPYNLVAGDWATAGIQADVPVFGLTVDIAVPDTLAIQKNSLVVSWCVDQDDDTQSSLSTVAIWNQPNPGSGVRQGIRLYFLPAFTFGAEPEYCPAVVRPTFGAAPLPQICTVRAAFGSAPPNGTLVTYTPLVRGSREIDEIIQYVGQGLRPTTIC